MSNKLTDLHNHLFAQLERLGNAELKDEDLNKEINRSKAITSISKEILDNAKLNLEAAKFTAEHLTGVSKLPSQFENTVEQPKIPESSNSIPQQPLKKTGNTYTDKTTFAKSLGYKDLTEALGDLGKHKFENKFKAEFK